MKKKFLTVVVALMLLPLSVIALAEAVPLAEKNNEKFEAIVTVGTFSVFDLINGEREYIPSFDNVNRYVTNWEEHMLAYTITVGSKTYQLGTDFAYTGHAEEIKLDPVFKDPVTKIIPLSARVTLKFVDYTFDFSAYAGGIEGTLNMRAVVTQGNGFMNSLSGTGDLRNVQIKETGLGESISKQGIVTVSHEGLVHGWPE